MNASRLYPGHGQGAGKRLGNYRVIRRLGKGGSAAVYLCQHRYMDTLAAVKVLRAGMNEREETNFYAEARIAASLIHPRIVRVLEFGVQGHRPYLVMDYAPNGTLHQLYSPGKHANPQDLVKYIEQAAEAVQYVHDQGLVHRDIKPENLLLGADNQVLLSDFGISINMQGTASHTGVVAGTAAYMAPELIEGEACFASDQYALGVIAYEWLCGRWPFVGSSKEIIEQHVYQFPPRLRELVPTIPSEVEEVVLRALAKNPRDRFASVLEFAAALKAAFGLSKRVGRPHTRSEASRPVAGKATSGKKPPSSRQDMWSKIFSLFTFDCFASLATGLALYGLKVAPHLLWLLLSFCLVLFALGGALIMRSRALVLLVCAITLLAALSGFAAQSVIIFAVCYLVLSGLCLPAAMALSVGFHDERGKRSE